MSENDEADWVKAKPSAVPRNGAVQGVASTVAKTPWKNEPASPSRGSGCNSAAADPLRQSDFENAEQIQREDEHDRAHDQERNRDW